VHFLGPKPVACLAGYLAQADVLVSPRVQGKNTPMKLYSYLHSGKATLATDLPTHTQVIDSHVTMLADPSPEAFSKGMLTLMDDTTLRSKLGMAGKTLIEEQYSSTVFHTKLHGLFDWLKMEIEPEDTVEKMPTSSQRGTR
jgi:glycosyltransferase involved in cell wall biosynthesis